MLIVLYWVSNEHLASKVKYKTLNLKPNYPHYVTYVKAHREITRKQYSKGTQPFLRTCETGARWSGGLWEKRG